MAKGVKENLIGCKFGMLTILDMEFRKKENIMNVNRKIVKKKYYECICECGNKKWIRADSITGGYQISCGCLSKAKLFKSSDITGNIYNRLKVINFTGEGTGSDELWLCLCECGNQKSFTKKQLYSNGIKSCGCRAYESRVENSKKANKKLNETNFIEGTSIMKINRTVPIKSNKSGFTGVSFDTTRQKWLAQIWFKNKHYNLGRFEKKEDAIAIRRAAEEKLHNEFLRNLKK